MSKWVIEDDSVFYHYDDDHVIQITREGNGLQIRAMEKSPPLGRTGILYCRFLNFEHLGIEVPCERPYDIKNNGDDS